MQCVSIHASTGAWPCMRPCVGEPGLGEGRPAGLFTVQCRAHRSWRGSCLLRPERRRERADVGGCEQVSASTPSFNRSAVLPDMSESMKRGVCPDSRIRAVGGLSDYLYTGSSRNISSILLLQVVQVARSYALERRLCSNRWTGSDRAPIFSSNVGFMDIPETFGLDAVPASFPGI